MDEIVGNKQEMLGTQRNGFKLLEILMETVKEWKTLEGHNILKDMNEMVGNRFIRPMRNDNRNIENIGKMMQICRRSKCSQARKKNKDCKRFLIC
jgi:hypothetical protein